MEEDLEGSCLVLMEVLSAVFACRNRGKTRTDLRIAGFTAEIRIELRLSTS
jgi:hypothetical protein